MREYNKNYGNDKKMTNIKQKKLLPGLYVTATPIGNLADFTYRAQDVLNRADVIACEDTRVTGKLLAHYGIKTPTISYHDHNSARMLPQILDRLHQGQIVALVSDAGTPLVSDPGYKLVHEARAAGIMVTSLPGASALLAALSSAGLPTDQFLFAGFLPNKTVARQKAVKQFKSLPTTLVFYESPKRLKESLKDIYAVLGERKVAVCRELTKLYEEIRMDDLSELIRHYEERGTIKGEVVIVIEPAREKISDDNMLDDALKDALEKLTVREAVAAVSYMTGLKRKKVYSRALEISAEISGEISGDKA